MHNLVLQSTATPIKKDIHLNKFSGQSMEWVWVSGVQASRLSTGYRVVPGTVWESPGISTQESPRDYTPFHTHFLSKLTDDTGELSPQSTGPIKSPDKIYKENRS